MRTPCLPCRLPLYGVLTMLAIFSTSCWEQPEGMRVTPDNRHAPALPVFAQPIAAAESRYLMVPFWTYTPQKQNAFESSFAFSSGGFSDATFPSSAAISSKPSDSFAGYGQVANAHWNNLIFCDRQSGQSHLLLDRRAVICAAYLPIAGRAGDQIKLDPARPLLFAIADRDTNGDGYISSADAVVLYATAPDGTNLTRLTPNDAQLAGIVADGADRDTIYVRILRDTNHDRRFVEGDDEALILHVDLRHPAEGQPVLDEEIKRRARAIVEGR